MANNTQTRIKELIDRLGRICAAGEWREDLNPSQWTTLSYLEKANRFSRSPSQVSDYLTTTRGTVSQTLKSLSHKGLIAEVRSDRDKRSISYSVNDKGKALLQKTGTIEDAISSLSKGEALPLLAGLELLIRNALEQRNFRAFGVCGTCRYYRKKNSGGFCSLLSEPLTPAESNQICHEYLEVA